MVTPEDGVWVPVASYTCVEGLCLLFTLSSSGTHQASPKAGSTGQSGGCKTIYIIFLPSG